MAKFTAEEVNALQAGGNEVCIFCHFPVRFNLVHSTYVDIPKLCFTSERGNYTLEDRIFSVILLSMAGL